MRQWSAIATGVAGAVLAIVGWNWASTTLSAAVTALETAMTRSLPFEYEKRQAERLLADEHRQLSDCALRLRTARDSLWEIESAAQRRAREIESEEALLGRLRNLLHDESRTTFAFAGREYTWAEVLADTRSRVARLHDLKASARVDERQCCALRAQIADAEAHLRRCRDRHTASQRELERAVHRNECGEQYLAVVDLCTSSAALSAQCDAELAQSLHSLRDRASDKSRRAEIMLAETRRDEIDYLSLEAVLAELDRVLAGSGEQSLSLAQTAAPTERAASQTVLLSDPR